MSKPSTVYISRDRREAVQTYTGYSFPCFLFGVIWFFVKKMYALGIAIVLIAIVISAMVNSANGYSYIRSGGNEFLIVYFIATICWILVGFVANDMHRTHLINKGFVPAKVIPLTNEEIAENINATKERKNETKTNNIL